MIKALSLLIIALAVPSHEQDTPVSPCPNVFSYEPPGTEPGRWYGVVNLSTDSTLHSLWLNIVLDSKADILGNWIGDVSTVDNIDFKIENTKMKIQPGPAVAVRFFVQYNPLNKTPKLLAIRLNGREICNAKTPHPVVDQPDTNNRPQRPSSSTSRPQTTDGRPGSRPEVRPDVRPDARPDIRPEDRPQTRPVNTGTRPSEDNTRPFYVRPQTPNAIPSDIAGGGERPVQQTVTQGSNSRPNDGYRLTTAPPFRQTTRRQDPNDFDVSTGDSEDTDEYFTGGQPLIVLPSGSGNKKKPNDRQQGVCGKVVLNNPIPLVVNGTPTLEGQWPWQIALYQTQTVDNKYICGGTLVSHRHIITAGHCVTRKNSNRVVNHNTLTVYLGKHNLRTSVNGVAVRFVEKITVHPEYNASSFSRDLAILELREPVKYSEYIRPACLWPDNDINLSNVIGKKGSVVGWGFDDTGVATEELSLVEMPVVDQETCIRSYSEFFVRFTSDYTYCAGYRDGTFNKRTGLRESTSVCNGDSGGGMVFNVDGTWFLRGLVSLSVARQNEYRCDPTHYVIFTDLAKFLPWIKQNIYDY